MVQISGKYQLEKNENFVEFMLASGAPPEKVKLLNNQQPVLEIIQNDNIITIKSDILENRNGILTSVTLNEEVQENLPNGKVLRSTTTLDGDTLTISSKSEAGFSGSRVYKFSETGLVVIMSRDQIDFSAKRYYRRIL